MSVQDKGCSDICQNDMTLVEICTVVLYFGSDICQIIILRYVCTGQPHPKLLRCQPLFHTLQLQFFTFVYYPVFSPFQTFTLTTVCACPGGCDEHGPISGGGGGGKSSSGGTDKAGIPGIVILSVYVDNHCTQSPHVAYLLY